MESYFTVRRDRGYSVVEFQTESLMNPLELERVGQGLYRLIDEDDAHRLLLDFSRVKYMSSQAIGILLTMNKKLSQFEDGALVLCAVAPQLTHLLKITRLDKILKIVPTQKDALAEKG